MNKKLKKAAMFLGILLAAAGLFGAGMAFAAGGAEPGTQGDPIVTLSYLESRLRPLEGNNDGIEAAGNGTSEYSWKESGSGFEKVTLDKGQTLTVDDGTVVIVYSGTGRVDGGTGFLNLSTGELFESGTSAVLYSLFMGVGGESNISASGKMTVYIAGSFVVN